ncbi:MAG: oxidoreductase [Actinobacteria bacterium]|nr:oxidoreductase [Actinomycetota bacterium]
MGLFDRFRRERGKPAGPGPSARTVAELKEFLRTREGVEGYAEPPTAVYAMTLCLVAGDGEYIRRPVRDERQSRGLCGEFGVPLYDARIVGYPRRMRDYERGVRGRRVELADLPPLEVTDERERDD